MPILNSADAMQAELVAWRRHLHASPEIGFDTFDTADFVAERLREFGCDEVVTGIGGTGVVALIHGSRGHGSTIGFRADMDALPLVEANDFAHASTRPGRMHACGHDGHTAMLLGAARQLAGTRNFAGSVALVFQPAEEIGQGALAMLSDGLVDRFRLERVYGMHNMPGIAEGRFALRHGAIMASSSRFTLRVLGVGGHAARPHGAVDPIPVGAQIVTGLQHIVSRGTDPAQSAVVSVTRIAAGTAFNIIPGEVEIWGTVRTLDMALVPAIDTAIRGVAGRIAAAAGATIDYTFDTGIGVTVNDPAEARFAAAVAGAVVGEAAVDTDVEPVLAGEDFSYMLAACPGALVFIGNGDTAGLHHPAYDFNDAIMPYGVSYWVRLAETALAPSR